MEKNVAALDICLESVPSKITTKKNSEEQQRVGCGGTVWTFFSVNLVTWVDVLMPKCDERVVGPHHPMVPSERIDHVKSLGGLYGDEWLAQSVEELQESVESWRDRKRSCDT